MTEQEMKFLDLFKQFIQDVKRYELQDCEDNYGYTFNELVEAYELQDMKLIRELLDNTGILELNGIEL